MEKKLAPRGSADRNQVLVDQQRAAVSKKGVELVVGLQGHAHQNVRVPDVGIMNGGGGDDDLSAAGPAPGFGPVRLGEGALLLVDETGRPPQNLTGKDDALSAKTGEDDFLMQRCACVGIHVLILLVEGMARPLLFLVQQP